MRKLLFALFFAAATSAAALDNLKLLVPANPGGGWDQTGRAPAGQRLPGVSVPTLKEQRINVEVFNWRGVFGAPGISEAQKQELIRTIAATVKSRSWQETLKRNDWSDVLLAGDEFKAYVDSEQKRVAQVLAEIGLVKK